MVEGADRGPNAPRVQASTHLRRPGACGQRGGDDRRRGLVCEEQASVKVCVCYAVRDRAAGMPPPSRAARRGGCAPRRRALDPKEMQHEHARPWSRDPRWRAGPFSHPDEGDIPARRLGETRNEAPRDNTIAAGARGARLAGPAGATATDQPARATHGAERKRVRVCVCKEPEA